MQGRLSPLVDGKIQAFPWLSWQEEFSKSSELGIHIMEWTLDQERLYENPLMTSSGQNRIRQLCSSNNISIPSLTGDCFMQSPFWKASGVQRSNLEHDFLEIIKACSSVGIIMVVVPLVDNGKIENKKQEDDVIAFLQSHENTFSKLGVKVIFESDFPPDELTCFISRLEPEVFGVNYDIGNSAALGFLPAEEFAAYGQRILNVHIKDRPFKGTTVPLGEGDADFGTVFTKLAELDYQGNYILQTARSENKDHIGKLEQYFQMSKDWIEHYGA
jgi:L-ribulose-5-phosphate 3-epimerase